MAAMQKGWRMPGHQGSTRRPARLPHPSASWGGMILSGFTLANAFCVHTPYPGRRHLLKPPKRWDDQRADWRSVHTSGSAGNLYPSHGTLQKCSRESHAIAGQG